MKKILLVMFFLTTSFFAYGAISSTSPGQAYASVNLFHQCSTSDPSCVDCSKGTASHTPVCHDVATQDSSKQDPILKVIKAAISILSYLVGAGAIIGILVSAIRIMISGGDSNAVAESRNALVYCAIGVFVAAAAQLILRVFLSSATK